MFNLNNRVKTETSLVDKNIKKELKLESRDLNSIGCFLLSHSYLEAYMRETFIYSEKFRTLNQNQKEILIKDSSKNIDFKGLLLYHLSKKNLNHSEYSKLKKANLFRNQIAHRLLENQIHSNKFKSEVKNMVIICLDYAIKFQEMYKIKLDEIYSKN